MANLQPHLKAPTETSKHRDGYCIVCSIALEKNDRVNDLLELMVCL